MIRTALESMGVRASGCLMVGDRQETDVGMAAAAGVGSALVLTGAAASGMVSPDGPRPDYVVASLDQLLPA
jgi:ribonucleotide monophosphatase NagD (HAD superfamily)